MTRCGGCDRVWTGIAEAHCTTCHRHFTGITAFDEHRGGPDDDRRCADPAMLVDGRGDPKLSERLRASGPVWGSPSAGEWGFGRQSTEETTAIGGQSALTDDPV